MMSDLKRHSEFRARSALASAGAFALAASCTWAIAAGGAGDAAAAAESHDTYTWSAELVRYDATDRVATLQARIENHADLSGAATLADGDRALLTWSGVFSAAGVRDITASRNPGFERFTMPVEFVSTEMDGRYLQFRVVVPSDDAAAIAKVSPGNWVTAVTSHQPGDWETAVIDMRAYNDVS